MAGSGPAVWMSASLIGGLGSSAFRPSTLHYGSVDIAHGLALLFGIGTKALPAWGSRRKWNNLWGGLAGRLWDGLAGRLTPVGPRSYGRSWIATGAVGRVRFLSKPLWRPP